ATVFALTQPLVGHVLGLRLAETQPAKLAAFELAPHTENPAPLTLGGILVDGDVKYALKIPMIGSLIARNDIHKPVPGLDEFPAEPLRSGPRRLDRGGSRMSAEIIVAAALFAGVLAYAVFGGADFGSGFYDATAGGARRGAEVRTLIDHSIGPVWEANHVWLVY